MTKIEDLSFHDSTIDGIDQKGDEIIIHISDVGIYTDNKLSAKVNGCLMVKKVYSIEIDTESANFIGPSRGEGEILDLEIDDNSLEIVIEWKNFDTRKHLTKSYGIKGVEVVWLEENLNP